MLLAFDRGYGMIRLTSLGLSVVVLVSLSGCNSQPKYYQAQLNSIETREVDAKLDQAFSAASSALFDAGYTIAMSDRNAGLISGRRGKDNTAARMWVSSFIRDTDFVISIQVREDGPNRSIVRVKTSVNGEAVVDKKSIDAIWVLMQRQVLMKEPSALAPAATGK